MTGITVVLADDHHLVRQGLLSLLIAEPDLLVIGEASNGLEAVSLVQKLHPKVLVLDMVMPHMNGLEVMGELKRKSLEVNVVILSMYDDEGYVLMALRQGASAYILKDSPPEEVVQGIRAAARGCHWLSSRLLDRVIDVYIHKTLSELSIRELQVLRQIAEGHTNSQIAAILLLSPKTVETYNARLIRKLCLRNQAELRLYASQRKALLTTKQCGPTAA